MKRGLILAVALIIFLNACATINHNALAQCLTENGAIMYGTSWCSHCQNQKKAFGESFDYIDFVDCDLYSVECQENGVQSYPTWIINDELYIGEQSLERLAGLAKCEYS